MSVIFVCPTCGHEREIDRKQILAGTWRSCPDCTVKRAARKGRGTKRPTT